MKMPPAFSSFILDRTAVMGGWHENRIRGFHKGGHVTMGSHVRFIPYACIHEGNHEVFFLGTASNIRVVSRFYVHSRVSLG